MVLLANCSGTAGKVLWLGPTIFYQFLHPLLDLVLHLVGLLHHSRAMLEPYNFFGFQSLHKWLFNDHLLILKCCLFIVMCKTILAYSMLIWQMTTVWQLIHSSMATACKCHISHKGSIASMLLPFRGRYL